MMKAIHTSLWALAALTLLPATGWSQDTPQRERTRAEMQRRIEQMRASGAELPPEAQRLMKRLEAQRRGPGPSADGWRIGVMLDPVSPLLRTHLNLAKGTGVVVERVVDGSPAARSGLRAGDLILASGDKPVGDLEALRNAVTRAAKEHKPLVLKVLKEGKPQMVRIMPPPAPKPAARDTAKPRTEKGTRPTPPPAAPGAGNERIARALREMRADLDKQREALRRLEKRVEEMGRPQGRN